MENEKGNFVKLSRSFLEWRWFTNENTLQLFLYLFLKANWKDAYFEGYEIKRGSLVTSLQTLASETRKTVKQVRTALEHLQKTGEISLKTTNRFTIVTIEKYEVFQGVQNNIGQTEDNHRTYQRQIMDSQTATIEEEKENKEEKEREEESPTSPFDSEWEEILALYPRCKGLELESKEKYFKTLEERNDKEKFLEDTKEAIRNYVERYREEHDNDLTYIFGFERFFSECLKKEIECYRSQKVVFTGWQQDEDKTIPLYELNEIIVNEYEHKEEIKYLDVLKEAYRRYPIHNFIAEDYNALYFGIVNRYADGTGANLLYAAVGKYLGDMENKKQYVIPEFGYWLKHEATGVMETVTEYNQLIPEE